MLSLAPDRSRRQSHSTDGLTFLVADDFLRARLALDDCTCNRHRDVGQALLSQPLREFLDLFRGA